MAPLSSSQADLEAMWMDSSSPKKLLYPRKSSSFLLREKERSNATSATSTTTITTSSITERRQPTEQTGSKTGPQIQDLYRADLTGRDDSDSLDEAEFEQMFSTQPTGTSATEDLLEKGRLEDLESSSDIR